jgi:RNA polymerase sigma factor (sigma-70 family)
MFPSANPVLPLSPSISAHEINLLVRSHSTRLAGFLRRRVSNPHDVEDLVQETFLEAVRCIHHFQGQSLPETWLFGIALNLVRSYYRRQKRRDIYVDVEMEEVAADAGENPLQIADARERASRVACAWPMLPENSRKLLQFVVFEDLSYEEAAQHFNIPIGTVRSRLSRTRAFLKRQMEGSSSGLRNLAAPFAAQPAA